jgi:DNA polymerase III delta subunit
MLVADDPVVAEEELAVELAREVPDEEIRVVDLTTSEVAEVMALLEQQPMFASRLRVVVRGVETLSADAASRLADALGEDEPLNEIVLVVSGKRVPKALAALKQASVETRAATRDGDRKAFIVEASRRRGIELDPAALALVLLEVGLEMAQVAPLVEVLAGVYGTGARLGPDEVRPYLVRPGEVPLWALTDAIESGRSSQAVQVLERLLGAEVAPQLILGMLERRYLDLVALAPPGVRTVVQAQAVLGEAGGRRLPDGVVGRMLRSARKLDQGRAIAIVGWIADAYRDLRGDSVLDPEAVLVLLVTRLSQVFR